MAGHSKWHNIRHRKAAQDAKKSKHYARVGKMIQLAAKEGPDPDMNPKLQLALHKAKQYNLPKDVIKKAIDKWSGATGEAHIEEVLYEWYGPWGVALLIKSLTDNPTRTAQNVRSCLSKYGGNLWTPWSVVWQFEEKGEIVISGKREYREEKGQKKEYVHPLDHDMLDMELLETDADDVEHEGDTARVYTSKEAYISVKETLEKNLRQVSDDDIIYIPTTYIDIDDDGAKKLDTLLDTLEEDDDVDLIWHNARSSDL